MCIENYIPILKTFNCRGGEIGRRAGLRSLWKQFLVGSSPIPGTKRIKNHVMTHLNKMLMTLKILIYSQLIVTAFLYINKNSLFTQLSNISTKITLNKSLITTIILIDLLIFPQIKRMAVQNLNSHSFYFYNLIYLITLVYNYPKISL